MTAFTEVAAGLRFPEGPVAMPDGSVLVVEMFGKCVTRIGLDGTKTKVADVAGGPNGMAVGPDGAIYLCNNGGSFGEVDFLGLTFPGPMNPDEYIGGRIQRIDPATGTVEDLYTECDGRPLRAPNDLVFDVHGGMWFTDHGIRHHRSADISSIFYAAVDGTSIREVVHPTDSPNGIGLSPNGDRLYWAETFTGRVFALPVTGPGETAPFSAIDPSVLLCGLPGLQLLDSLAVDGEGNVCVATLGLQTAGITVVSPHGEVVEQILTGDPLTTNLCFGGADGRTAYVTCSGTGRLVSMQWPHAGLVLNH
jgi:gluconolactonase